MSTPSETARAFPARYNDGRTAATLAVQVRAEPRGLIIADADGDIDWWPWPEVQLAEPPARARPIRLSNRSRPGVRLAIDDPAVLPALRLHARYLHRNPIGRKGLLTAAGTAAICALVVAVFVYGLPWMARPLAAVIPIAWEQPVGESTVVIVNRIFARGREICTGAAGDAALQAMTRQLAATIETPYRIRVSVADSGLVNALAAPGGRIVVFRGLIDRAASAEEVAGVLAHEIAHVTERHSIHQMEKAQTANVGVGLACVLTRVCESQTSQALINVAGSAVFANFSRQDEADADAKAVRYTTRAGISPKGIPAMFRKLIEERQRSPGGVDAWFSTHPLEEDRITATQALIDQMDPDILSSLTVDSRNFHDFRQRVAALPPPPAGQAG